MTVIMAMVALPTWFQLEAIVRGATVIDVIILNTEVNIQKKIISSNPFSLLINLFGTVLEQVKKRILP
jgi:hypothetical protein